MKYLPPSPLARRCRRWVAVPARRLCLLFSAVAACSLPAWSQAGDLHRLRPDLPVERPLAAGETHVYSFGIPAADPAPAWWLRAEQMGIDLEIELWGLEGESRGLVDGPLDRWGTEWLLVEPAAVGHYRLEVRPSGRRVAAGRYRLRLERREATSAAGRRYRAAVAAHSAAGRAAKSALAEAAIPLYSEARSHWRALGERAGEALALHALAELDRRADRYRQAADIFRQVEEHWRRLGEDGLAALALGGLGWSLLDLGDLDAARPVLSRALEHNRELGRVFEAAENRANLALVDHFQGFLHRALDGYREALGLYQRAGDRQQEAILLSNVGGVHYLLGDAAKALDHFRRSLAMHRADGDAGQEIGVLNNLAALHRKMGEPETALALYAEVLDRTREIGGRRAEARARNNIGYAYLDLGELERARGYFERALTMRHELGDRRGESATLSNLGAIHHALGELRQAYDFHRRALELKESLGDQRGTAILSSWLGLELAGLGENGAAADALRRARELVATGLDRPVEALVLQRRGQALVLLDQPAAAVAPLERALELYLGLRDRPGEATARVTLARAERSRGRRDAARRHLDKALGVIESRRAAIRHPELRAAFLSSRRAASELLVAVLMDLDRERPDEGFDRLAFAAAEGSRARVLLELLAEARAELRRDLDPDLRQRHRELVRRLSLLVWRRGEVAAGRRQAEPAEHLDAAVEGLRAELDRVEAAQRRAAPRFAALTRPPQLTAAEVQGLLDNTTVLLYYALGEERGWLWAITADAFASFPLPPRREVEAAARETWEELSTLDPTSGGSAGAAALSAMVLEPVAGRLTGGPAGRVVIVPDGALHYVPFAALPLPAPEGGRSERLLTRHEVLRLPSLSVLQALSRPGPGRRTVAVLADPVFDTGDPRYRSPEAGGEQQRPAIERSAAGSLAAGPSAAESLPPRVDAYVRLPASRREAEAIAALLPAPDVALYLGFEADRDLVLGGDLGAFRIIHFATHGVVDSHDPRLSGLVLSRIDRHGRPRDGTLRLDDIYNLALDAELVVLSGCQTALGKELRGEGLWGLTHGFLYAGAQGVMASLWQVQDRATAELMRHFYRALLADGRSPAAALRSAQLAISAERRWRHPYYWAAFVVEGDWR